MFLLEVEGFGNSVEVELPRTGLQIDPRPMDADLDELTAFEITYGHNGTSVTITKINAEKEQSWWDFSVFRVYDPATEVVPSFDSTTYTYLGVKGEKVPCNTIVGIIDPSVKIIRYGAFEGCTGMKVCLMHDDVEEIERLAFRNCEAMETIRLSRTLKKVDNLAFAGCASIDALFIPSSVEEIGHLTFCGCRHMRILSLPPNITTEDMGRGIIGGCEDFYNATQIQRYRDSWSDDDDVAAESEMINQSVLDFYHNLPPLNKACLDTNVSAQSIHDCVRAHGAAAAFTIDHNGMTPLHILTMNPYATTGSIRTCLDLHMGAAFVEDDYAMTPVDYLWAHDNVECLVSVIQALCIYRGTKNRERPRCDSITKGSHKTKRKKIE